MSIRYYGIHVLQEYFTKFLKLKNSCSWMCRPGIQRTKVWLRSYIHGNLAWTTAPRGTRLCNSLSTSCRLTCAVTSLTSTPTCALTKTLTTITSPSSTSKHRDFHVLEPRIPRDFDSGVSLTLSTLETLVHTCITITTSISKTNKRLLRQLVNLALV